MCLSIVARILELDADEALVELNNVRKTIHVGLLPDLAVGDYVLIHTGFAIAKIDEEEARKIFAAYQGEVAD